MHRWLGRGVRRAGCAMRAGVKKIKIKILIGGFGGVEVFRFLYQPRPSAGAPTGALSPNGGRPKRKRDS